MFFDESVRPPDLLHAKDVELLDLFEQIFILFAKNCLIGTPQIGFLLEITIPEMWRLPILPPPSLGAPRGSLRNIWPSLGE